MFSFTHPHHSFNSCLYIITSLAYFCQCQLIKRVPFPHSCARCNFLQYSAFLVSTRLLWFFYYNKPIKYHNRCSKKSVLPPPKSFIYQKRRFQFSLYKKTAHHLLITEKLSIAAFFSHYLFNFNRYCSIFAWAVFCLCSNLHFFAFSGFHIRQINSRISFMKYKIF